jgi:hypothetical protein
MKYALLFKFPACVEHEGPFHYSHMPTIGPYLSWLCTVHALTSCFPKFYCDNYPPSMAGSPN